MNLKLFIDVRKAVASGDIDRIQTDKNLERLRLAFRHAEPCGEYCCFGVDECDNCLSRALDAVLAEFVTEA